MSDDDPLDISDESQPSAADEQTNDDASSVKGRARREKRIDRDEREAEHFWRGVLSDPIGRRELWRVIAGGSGAHAFEARFLSGPSGVPDPKATDYARGEQDFGLRFYHKLLALDPAAVAAMHAENDGRFAKPKRAVKRVTGA